jgi:hypothetical protein
MPRAKDAKKIRLQPRDRFLITLAAVATFARGILVRAFIRASSGFHPTQFASKSVQGRLVFSILHNTLLI